MHVASLQVIKYHIEMDNVPNLQGLTASYVYFTCEINICFPLFYILPRTIREIWTLSSKRSEHKVGNEEIYILVLFLSLSDCVTWKSLHLFDLTTALSAWDNPVSKGHTNSNSLGLWLCLSSTFQPPFLAEILCCLHFLLSFLEGFFESFILWTTGKLHCLFSPMDFITQRVQVILSSLYRNGEIFTGIYTVSL